MGSWAVESIAMHRQVSRTEKSILVGWRDGAGGKRLNLLTEERLVIVKPTKLNSQIGESRRKKKNRKELASIEIRRRCQTRFPATVIRIFYRFHSVRFISDLLFFLFTSIGVCREYFGRHTMSCSLQLSIKTFPFHRYYAITQKLAIKIKCGIKNPYQML